MNSNQPVYLVVLRGHFVCRLMCSSPPGSGPPRGTVITVSIDRTSLEETDFGVTDRPRLPAGGPGFTLTW